MSIKCVTLEVTGAIIALRTSVPAIYANALRKYGLPSPSEEVLKGAYTRAFPKVEKQFPNWGNTQLPDYKDWWKKAVAATFEEAGVKLPDGAFPYVFQALYAEFGVPDSWMVHPDAIPFINWCKEQGFLVGGNCVGYGRYIDGVLPMLGVARHLDFCIVSKDVGVQKPDPAAFDVARKEATKVASLLQGKRDDGKPVKAAAGAEVAFNNILHIGDNVKKDFGPAQKLGMSALLLDRKGEWAGKSDPVVKPEFTVRSLADVPRLLQDRKLL